MKWNLVQKHGISGFFIQEKLKVVVCEVFCPLTAPVSALKSSKNTNMELKAKFRAEKYSYFILLNTAIFINLKRKFSASF